MTRPSLKLVSSTRGYVHAQRLDEIVNLIGKWDEVTRYERPGLNESDGYADADAAQPQQRGFVSDHVQECFSPNSSPFLRTPLSSLPPFHQHTHGHGDYKASLKCPSSAPLHFTLPHPLHHQNPRDFNHPLQLSRRAAPHCASLQPGSTLTTSLPHSTSSYFNKPRHACHQVSLATPLLST